MSDQLQRVDDQAGKADEHYEKLCKLEQVAREWIAGKQVAYGIYSELVDEATTSEDVERWSSMAIRAREGSEYLTALLKEAGLE